ncbi:MAG: LuxR C-terminal-related transcriptional regulator [Actinomycetota bacterium]
MHELLEGSRDKTIVRDDEGRWTLIGPLAESARLADLVASRLSVLTDQAKEAMAVVALGAPLSLPLAKSAIGEAFHELEDRGLVSVASTGGEPALLPAHPLYGEILAANLTESRRRNAYRRLVEEAVGNGLIPDQLRVAVWQSRSGEVISEELAHDGAWEALIRHEPELAETLVRPAGIEDDRSLLILGRALSYQQRFEEAEQVLSKRPVEGSPFEGELVSIRAQNLGFGLGRSTEARDLLAAGVSRIDDPAMRARLNNERGMVSAISGDFVDARSASRAVLSDDESSDVARVAAYVTLTLAQAMMGDCHSLKGVVSEAVELAEDNRASLPFARDQIEIMWFCSLLSAGEIDEANGLASRAIDRSDRGGALLATWLAASCLGLDLAGLLEHASSAAREALELYKKADPFGLEDQAIGLLSMTLGQMGAETASGTIEGERPAEAPRIAVWWDRGRAWSAAAAGRIEEGASIAVSGGRSAASREHFAWAALCFHDAVRLGLPALAIDDLRAIDDSRGAVLLSLMKRHAEALVLRDVTELDEVARAFGELGAPLLAAEVFGQLAAIIYEQGDLTQAARACVLSHVFEQRCEAPDTPALRHRPQLVTSREMEVAIRAASGLTSPQIAEEFFISGRTVDNHLRSVYRKLNVGGRGELADLVG